MQFKLDQRLREVRQLKELMSQAHHDHEVELENLKNQNKSDLEMIQDKVTMAMGKKKEIIDALHNEVKIKDL